MATKINSSQVSFQGASLVETNFRLSFIVGTTEFVLPDLDKSTNIKMFRNGLRQYDQGDDYTVEGDKIILEHPEDWAESDKIVVDYYVWK